MGLRRGLTKNRDGLVHPLFSLALKCVLRYTSNGFRSKTLWGLCNLDHL